MKEISDNDLVDIGAGFEEKVTAILDKLDFNRSAGHLIEKRSIYWRFELPEMPEEIVIARGERHKLILVSGIETTEDGEFVSFVAVGQPFMGWEINKFCDKDVPKARRPEWALQFGEYFSGEFYQYEDYFPDTDFVMRMYKPVYAVQVKDDLNDEVEYQKRNEIVFRTLGILCRELGLLVYSTESGDIPRIIEDKYIHPKLIKFYNRRLNEIDRQLKEEPNDPELLFQKAGLLASREDNEEALKLIKRSIKLQPRSPQSWYLLSDIYTKLGDEDKAVRMENRARQLQKYDGMPHSFADITEISSIFHPLYEKIYGHKPDGDDEDDDDDGMLCDRCDNDFLYYIKGGLYYICNDCGNVDMVEGAALKVELEIEKNEYYVTESDHIRFKVKLENISDHGLEYTTEHEGMEFIVNSVYDKPIKGRFDDKSLEYEGGFLIGAGSKKRLEPGEKDEMVIKLDEIEILTGRTDHFMMAGHFSIGLWMKVIVYYDNEILESYTDVGDIDFRLI